MKKRAVPLLVAGALAIVTCGAPSLAQSAVAAAQTKPEVPPPIYRRPNSSFLGKGIFAFLGAYFPSVLVAIVNDNSYDKRLYYPVLGPWLDLAERPGCGGPGQSTCGAETAFKTLLIASGVAQGVGAVGIVLGLALPERLVPPPAPPRTESRSLRVLPAPIGRGGYGVAAFGRF